MAGIWERVRGDADDRINAHLFEAAFVFNATGTFTEQQIINALNDNLISPLTANELTDLNNITSQMSLQANNTLKLIYMEKIKSALICAEVGVINEVTFRSILNIA